MYALGAAAVLCAAVASGLIAPRLARQIPAAEPSAQDGLRLLFRYTGHINQAFAGIFVVASSAAVTLWSAAIVKGGALARGIGVAGCIVGAASLVAFLSGHLRLNVHGFGLFVLTQAAWATAAGLQMIRSAEPGEARTPPG